MKFSLFFLMTVAVGMLSFTDEETKGKVVSVLDGNTVEVLTVEGERHKILLFGIDSPDSGQNFSDHAKTLLTKLVLNKDITLVLRGKDRTGTRMGEIQIPGAHDPRHELIREGLTWTTENNPEWEMLKEHARNQGLGLWSEEHPMPPWLYRRQQSMMQAKGS